MTKKNTLIVCDPLIPPDMTSHNFELCEYILDKSRHLGLNALMGWQYRRSLARNKYVRMVRNLSMTFMCCLKDLKDQGRNSVATKYLNPNADPFWLLIIFSLSRLMRSPIRIHAHFIGTNDAKAFRYSILVWITKIICKSKYVKISAETEAYSKFLSNILQIECLHLPFPPIDGMDFPYKFLQKESFQTKSELQLVFLGAPRKDKGISELPLIVQTISEICRKIEFRYQGGLSDQILEEIELTRVSIHEMPKYLTKSEFINEIKAADFVLIPYLKESFELRGSSICQRSIYANASVIARRETSLIGELEKAGYGPVITIANDFVLMSPTSVIKEKHYSEYVAEKWELVVK